MSAIFESLANLFKTKTDPIGELVRIIYADEETEAKEVKEWIAKLKSENRSVDGCSKDTTLSPLMCVFCSMEKRYWIAMLLLEAKANPHFVSIKGFTLTHKFIDSEELSKLRLLLWYNPDYEKLLNDESPNQTALERIEFWNAELLKRNRPEVKGILNKTVQDFHKMKKMTDEGNKYATENNFRNAAIKYKEVADIFAEHLKIEKSFKPTDFFISRYLKDKVEDNERFLQSSIWFYTSKMFEYYKSSEECYRKIPNPNRSIKNEHLGVLEKLVKVCSELQLSITHYRERIDILKQELNPTPTPLDILTKHILILTDHKSNVEEVESAPLLLHHSSIQYGNNLHKRNVLGAKSVQPGTANHSNPLNQN